MQGRGLLVAAIVLIATGLIGSAAVAAALLAGSTDERADFGRRDGESVPGTSSEPFGPRRRGPRRGFPPDGEFGSDGERIWFTGVGEDGPIPREPSFGPAMMGGCAVCHGEDGRGSRFHMMGRTFDAPDIRYRTLTSEHEEDGRTEEAWTDEEIARAVRTGEEPGGDRLETTMPRWDISEEDFDELLRYMRAL